MNSWTAEPGAMSYDADRDGGRRNAECPLCWRAFYRAPDDDGSLCDQCSSAEDWRAQERKRLAQFGLKPRQQAAR